MVVGDQVGTKKVLVVGSMSSMLANFNQDNLLILQKLGYEVHVAANFGKEDPVSRQKKQSFSSFLAANQITKFNLPFPRGMGKVSQNLKLLQQLNQIIGKQQYEFIHTNSPLASVLVRLVAWKKRVPVIYTVHGFQFYQGGPRKDWLLFYPVEKLLAKVTHTLITINREDYRRAQKMCYPDVKLLPGVGIETKKFQQLTSRHSQKIVLTTIGELNDNKNQLCVLRALRDSALKSKIEYVLCGIGQNEQLYREYVQANQLEENVIFMGYQEDVLPILARTDVFVFPSFREGLSVAVMEAMAAGKPVFASRIRGNVDLIDEQRGGLFFDPADSQSLTKLLDHYLMKTSLLAEMGHYNQEKIQGYSREVVNQKMTEIYQDMTQALQPRLGGSHEE